MKNTFVVTTSYGQSKSCSIDILPTPKLQLQITQRAFAPWKKFGSIYGTLPNSFSGDNRGFSLKAGAKFPDERVNDKVTSRLNQIVKVNLYDNIHEKIDKYASLTQGNFLFIIPNESDLEDPYAESSFKNNHLQMRIAGQDPLVVPAPNIDVQLELDFEIKGVPDKDDDYHVHITGKVAYKAFPAYEAFIEDEFGTKLFLHTYSVIHEEKLAFELMDVREMLYSIPNWTDDKTFDKFSKIIVETPTYDYKQTINITILAKRKDGKLAFEKIIKATDIALKAIPIEKIKREKEGLRGLLGNLLQLNSVNLGTLMTENGRKYVEDLSQKVADGQNKLKAEFITTTYDNISIDKWNNLHLDREAALDLTLKE